MERSAEFVSSGRGQSSSAVIIRCVVCVYVCRGISLRFRVAVWERAQLEFPCRHKQFGPSEADVRRATSGGY